MEITYKKFFEKAKEKPFLQRLILDCFSTAIKTTLIAKQVFPNKPKVDSGELMLRTLDVICRTEGLILTDSHEITAKYMSDIINSMEGMWLSARSRE